MQELTFVAICADRDSPNQLPIFDMLQVGAFSELVNNGKIKECYYQSLEWLISLGLSVEGEDVAGYTALQHSLTCTPLVHDFEWSSILLRACPDPIAALNHRNRYGSTAMHEQVMTYNRDGEDDIRGQALEFCLARGGNADIPDHEGSTCRRTATRCQLFMEIIEDFDEMFEQDGGCNFCRRGGTIGGGVEGNGKNAAVMPGTQGPTPRDKNGIAANLRCGRCRSVMCESFALACRHVWRVADPASSWLQTARGGVNGSIGWRTSRNVSRLIRRRLNGWVGRAGE